MTLRVLSSVLSLLLAASTFGCGGSNANPDPDGGPVDDQAVTDGGGDDQGGGDAGPHDAGDMTPPEPGAAGALTVSNATSGSMDVEWARGTDDTTDRSALEYRVYYSLEDNLDTVADVLANGTAADDWQADVTTLTVRSLAHRFPYYFNVLVRDEAGNAAAHVVGSAETLNGEWEDPQPLESYTGGSVNSTRFVVSPTGDVAIHWTQDPSPGAHFTTRSHSADAFGASSTPWGGVGVITERISYGFDGSLVAASHRENMGESEVLFARYTAGQALSFQVVAGDLATAYLKRETVCVAENGDVMVAWMDGTDFDAFAVRARLLSGGTWGTPLLVSGGVGRDLSNLEVVCSPDGDHVFFYGEDSGSDSSLMARVYDASEGEWHGLPRSMGDVTYLHEMTAVRTDDGMTVVGFEEYDDDHLRRYMRTRTFRAGLWSATETLADDYYSWLAPQDLQLAAAGNHVHAFWRTPNHFISSRLVPGTTLWGGSVTLEAVSDVQEYCVVGDRFGGARMAWVTGTSVQMRLYEGEWGSTGYLENAGQPIGAGSLSCILDARRRASFAWTLWDPTAMQYSAFTRTFR